MSSKEVLRLKRDKNGNRGIFIYQEDVCLLKQIMIHQSMRATDIHDFFQTFSRLKKNQPRNNNSITNRLGKLRAAGILIQSKIKLKGSYFLYHYRLGARGIDVLIKLGHLDPKLRERFIQMSRKFSIPSEHTEAMSHIANQVYLTLRSNDLLTGFQQARGSAHNSFGHSAINRKLPDEVVVPDWVFSFRDTIVCIEVDTGSQWQQQIENKYKNYSRYAKRFIEEGKKVIVLFSVVDGTIVSRFSENRDKRIASIQNLAPPLREWGRDNELPSNGSPTTETLGLQFYVSSAKQTRYLVERLLIGSQSLSPYERYQYAMDWVSKARHVLSRDYEIYITDLDKVFAPRRDRSVDCDLFITIKSIRTGNTKHFAVIYGEEGSVQTQQQVETNAKRIAGLSDDVFKDAALLVCYDEQSNIVESVFGLELPCEMWLTDSASWVAAMNEGNYSAPLMLYVVSQFKKEWRSFYE